MKQLPEEITKKETPQSPNLDQQTKLVQAIPSKSEGTQDYLDKMIAEQAAYYGMTVEDYVRCFDEMVKLQEYVEGIGHG